MGKSGREGIRASEQHLPRMGKLGRERIRASEQHSPKDGQGREGIRAGKGTHQLGKCRQTGSKDRREMEQVRALTYGPMDEQVREGGNGSEQAALTNRKVQRDSVKLLRA